MDKVTLQTPVARKGSEPITEVTLRRPTVGDLRGLTLLAVVQLDVKAHERLLPRITLPSLLPEEVAALDPADFMALAGVAASFLATNADKEQFGIPT
jgi:hypothetical protein